MGSQGYMHGIGEYLGAVCLAQNGSRLRSGPPFGRTYMASLQRPRGIQIRSDSPIGMSIRTLITCHVHTNQRVGTNFLR